MQKTFKQKKKKSSRSNEQNETMNFHIRCNFGMWTEPANRNIVFSVMKKMYMWHRGYI